MSLVTVFSKNLLPKVITIIGIALWICFAFHPKLPASTMLMQRAENMAVAGALLFIGGSESFEKQITFGDFRSASESATEAEETKNQNEASKNN